MKYLILILALSIIACTPKKQDISSKTEEAEKTSEDQRSIHQREWEQFKSETEELGDISELVNVSFSVITDSDKGSFNNPKFSANGDFLLFSNQDYNKILKHNLKEGTTELVVDMPGCGVDFQISPKDEIYFRNRAKSRRGSGNNSIFKYSITSGELDMIYESDERITRPVLVHNFLYFLEGDQPYYYDLKTNQIGSNFRVPFYYAENNYLIKVTGKKDTLSIDEEFIKFINCRYSKDLGFIYSLTSNNGIAVFDIEGNFIKVFPEAFELDKLSGSNLVVFSVLKEEQQKIAESNLFIGFLNSSKVIKINNDTNELRFNPSWSNAENEISYANGAAQIKTVSFNFEK